MSTNSELYLIGLATLFFLVIVFLYVRKISSSGKLKVKIETVSNLEESSQPKRENQQTFDFEVKESKQELAILNLISVDKSFYEIEQVFGFLIMVEKLMMVIFLSLMKMALKNLESLMQFHLEYLMKILRPLQLLLLLT